jgi:hypothetical protein
MTKQHLGSRQFVSSFVICFSAVATPILSPHNAQHGSARQRQKEAEGGNDPGGKQDAGPATNRGDTTNRTGHRSATLQAIGASPSQFTNPAADVVLSPGVVAPTGIGLAVVCSAATAAITTRSNNSQ